MRSFQAFVFAIGMVIACGPRGTVAAEKKWISDSKSAPQLIQIMPKSAKSGEFIAFSNIIPGLEQDEKSMNVTVYDFAWPITASKETGQWLQVELSAEVRRHRRDDASKESGQWLQIEADGGATREAGKFWVNKDQLLLLSEAAAHYNEQLQADRSAASRADHWLLGIVLESQKQREAARFQYEKAFEAATGEGLDDKIAHRALWGYARLSAELFKGDLPGVDRRKFLKLVECTFGRAECPDNDVPAFYTSWGEALEMALPAPKDALIEYLYEQTGRSPTRYPYDIVLPPVVPKRARTTGKAAPADEYAPPDATSDEAGNGRRDAFRHLRRDIERILCKYYQAELDPLATARPAVDPHDGLGIEISAAETPTGVAEPTKEDTAQWDMPHRLIGSLYRRYAIKRSPSEFLDLYIDTDGVKPEWEKSVTADDELSRALRRSPNAGATHDERAQLYFGYFKRQKDAASALDDIEHLDEYLIVARDHYEEALREERWSEQVREHLRTAATKDLANRIDELKKDNLTYIEGSLAETDNFKDFKMLAQDNLEDAREHLYDKTVEWRDVLKEPRLFLKRTKHVLSLLQYDDENSEDIRNALKQVYLFTASAQRGHGRRLG